MLQHWLHGRVLRWVGQSGMHRVSITPYFRQTFSLWSDPSFLSAGVPLEQVSRHAVVFTDASATGRGRGTYNRHAILSLWMGPQMHWHINCLELLAVCLALGRLKGPLHGKHVLVGADNTATVAYINRQGGLHSHRMLQLARHLLLWSQKHLRSLYVIQIPGVLNGAADELSQQPAPLGEWRLHPQTVQLIWDPFGAAQIDLFASPDSSHCQLFYFLTKGTLGMDALAHSWPRGLRMCFPQTYAPHDSPSLAHSSEEGPTFSAMGLPMAPASRPLETPCLVPGWDAEVLGDLPQAVVDTITSSRAPTTRVGDLLAFLVNESCLEFVPANSHVVLRTRPGYVPKVPTTPFSDQVVNLQALPSEEKAISQIATLFRPGYGPHLALVEYGSGPHAAWNDGPCVAHSCLPDLGHKQAIAMPHVSQEQRNKPELDLI
ncbi:hypothetical protein PO909_025427 [Leuciscus waleckii]